ncbi:MAG: glycosyltransferase family 39 protein [Caldilineaceae bacterium]|nr:glycosyltransferase family 39 protein [Caldilineaceae bacterium]
MDRSSRTVNGSLGAAIIFPLLVLLLVAFFLRIYHLASAPPGMHFDEGANGVDALRVWQGVTPLFFPANNGREPLYIYLTSLFVGVLGNNTLALRLPAAFAGTVAVATTFALGRRLLDERVALIGAGFIAVTFWTVSLSRIAYRANLFLALFPIWLLLFWRCRNRTDLRPYLLAGLALGGMQYTYIAARFAPLLLIVLAVDWRRTLRWRGVATTLLTAGVVAAPLALAIYLNPAAGFQRSEQVWLFSRPEPLALFWLQFTEHLKLFGLTGDPIWLHNLPGRPPVSWFVAPFFVIGAGFSLRHPAPRALLWTVLVMIWPGILAVSGTPLPPNHLRVLVIAPAVFLLAGYGITRLFGERRAGWALLIGLLLVTTDGALSFRDYARWQGARETFEQYDADMLNVAHAIDANPDTFYVIPLSWGWPRRNYWSIDFITDFKRNYAVVERPFLLDDLPEAPRIGLVRWLAGMHVDADPQHRLDAQLRLNGYIADGSEQGQTYQIEYFRPVVAQRNRVELAGGPVVTDGGLELADAVVYCFRPAGAPDEQLAVDLTWHAPGPQPVDASVSMRLMRIEADGGGAAQVDAWLQNANGRGAPAWDSPDGGTQFFEFPDDPIAAGAYEVWAIPYATASMQALPVVGEPPSYSLGRIDLPLCHGQP